MADYITIDMGTSNTRINLVSGGRLSDGEKIAMGAGKGIENKELLRLSVKDGIDAVIKRNPTAKIERILASGMITSEGGLLSLDHIKAPCGIKELNSAMHEVVLDDISDIPFVLIPGVKTVSDSFEELDMMRGEEVELAGLCEGIEPSCLYVLPGSHSKLIHTDSQGRISAFSTELTGELMAAVSGATILKNSVTLDTVTNEKYLDMGYTYAKEKGINAALFKVRIIDKLLDCGREAASSFFKGVVFASEIDNIISAKEKKVIIGGKRELREAMVYLLKKYSDKEIISADDEKTANATALGAVRIYEWK